MRFLGKLPAKKLAGLPRLGTYTRALPNAPVAIDWSQNWGQWGIMANDRTSDCTAAACGHAIQTWTAYGSMRFTPPDTAILDFYSRTTGYNPSDKSTDRGGYMTTVMNYWLANDLAGHKIDAIAELHVQNLDDLHDAIWIFGGANLGVELPRSAINQTVWTLSNDDDPTPNSWGGHDIWALAYDKETITFVSWGQLMKMTIPFYQRYCSEAYGILSKDWVNIMGAAPNGFKMNDLVADMNALALTP